MLVTLRLVTNSEETWYFLQHLRTCNCTVFSAIVFQAVRTNPCIQAMGSNRTLSFRLGVRSDPWLSAASTQLKFGKSATNYSNGFVEVPCKSRLSSVATVRLSFFSLRCFHVVLAYIGVAGAKENELSTECIFMDSEYERKGIGACPRIMVHGWCTRKWDCVHCMLLFFDNTTVISHEEPQI